MKKRIVCLTLAFLLIGLAGLSFPGSTASEEKEASLLCLNIGKADCLMLTYGDMHYLIDTGYEHTYAALETALKQFHVDHLNGVFLTHCHQDHQGGLIPLAKSDVQVDAWYAPKIYFDVSGTVHPAVQAAALRGDSVTWLKAGETIPVGEDASFTVLGPIRQDTENENNNSLVMRFASPAGNILLTGDMKKAEAKDLEAFDAFVPCELIKIGHHGDGSSTTKDMVKAVRPKSAVISTDSREETDTPASSVLSKLTEEGCAVYVTQDAHDALLFTLRDGEIASVQDIRWDGVPERLEGLTLSLDVGNDAVTITNTSATAVRLEGCKLFSTRGDQLLNLPAVDLEAGQSYVIGTRKTKGQMDYFWDTGRIWHQTKLDTAILYDAYGRILACTNNGMHE